MDIYIVNKTKTVNAHGIFNEKEKTVTVCKGSIISEKVSGGSFRSAKSVEKMRSQKSVKGNEVIEDILFKSASSAANFVTGSSTNGLIAWKTSDGKKLKDVIE